MKATILAVEVVSSFGENRLMIKTDGSFKNQDKEGKEVTSNTFGISQKHLFEAICNNKIFGLMKAMRVGRNIKPEYLGLLLLGSEIEFDVKKEKAGTIVRGTKLDKDTFVTTLGNIVCHVDKDFADILMNERKDWFSNSSTPKPVVNPFV